MSFVKNNSLVTMVLTGFLIVIMAMASCGGASTATVTATATTTSTTTTTTQVVAFDLNVSAASSLTDAITEINKLYMQKHTNITIVTNLAASGTLQKQIEQGAPADVFISAGAKQMQSLQDGGLLLDGTRQNLLTNKVVLVVPSNSTLNITSFTDLTKANVLKIAIGDPESVPAGTYGKQALDQLGIYEQVKSKLILCSDVKQVLSYVEAGNVDSGIVYATDAANSKSVKVVANAPAEVNAKIIYPIAVIKASKNADAAKAYIAFLLTAEAKAIFEKYGFVVVTK
jgi:molybdate transport system substrate-binding protein